MGVFIYLFRWFSIVIHINCALPIKANLFSLYTWEFNFGQTKYDKTEGAIGVIGKTSMGATWELDGNMMGTAWEPSQWLHEALIFKTVCHHF